MVEINMTLQFAYTARDYDIVSAAIRTFQQWDYSHCLIIINGNRYYESIHKVDKVTGKNGVRGPIALCQLHGWVKESRRNRLLIQDVPNITEKEIENIELKLQAAVKKITYAPLLRQMLPLGRMLRAGHGLNPWEYTDGSWDCSETIAQVMPDWFGRRVLRLGFPWRVEEIVPGQMRREPYRTGPGLYQLVEEWKRNGARRP